MPFCVFSVFVIVLRLEKPQSRISYARKYIYLYVQKKKHNKTNPQNTPINNNQRLNRYKL